MIEILKNKNFENNNTLGDMFERKKLCDIFFSFTFSLLILKKSE